jgi:transposase
MQTIMTIGLDIAKSVFQVHGIDAEGKVIVRRQLKRRYRLSFFEKLQPCLIGIEACASSHYWSHELKALGHTCAPDATGLRKALCQTAEERCLIVAPVGRNGVEELLDVVADANDKRLPEVARACLRALGTQLRMLKAQILKLRPNDHGLASLQRDEQAAR